MKLEDRPTYEESVDLAALLGEILRKWKWLLGAVVLGAVLLGGYKGLVPAEVQVDEEAVTAAQTALDESRAALDAGRAELKTNGDTIAADGEKIAANEELLETYRATQKQKEQNLAALAAGLDRAQDVLADETATAEETSELIVQLPTLTNEIAEASDQVNAAAAQVRAAENEITGWETEIESLTARNETLTQSNQDLEGQVAEREAALTELQAGTPKSKSVVTYVVLGAVLGVLVVCGAVFLRFVMDKRLRCSEELKRRYGLPILGELCSEKTRGHKGFEKKLDALTGDIQTVPEEEEVYALIAAGMWSAVREVPVTVAVTGTVDKAVLEEVCEKLRGHLPEGFEVCAKEDPVYHAGSLAEIGKYRVLLVEAKGVSEKREIGKLAEVLRRSQADVLGAVVR